MSHRLPHVTLPAVAQPLQQSVAAQTVAGHQRRSEAGPVRRAVRSPLAQPLRRIRPEGGTHPGRRLDAPRAVGVAAGGRVGRHRPVQQPPEQGLQLHIRGDDHEVDPIVSCRGPGPRAKRGPDPVRLTSATGRPRAEGGWGKHCEGRPKASAAHSRLGQAPAHRPPPATMLTGNYRHAILGEVARGDGLRFGGEPDSGSAMGPAWSGASGGPGGSASSDPRQGREFDRQGPRGRGAIFGVALRHPGIASAGDSAASLLTTSERALYGELECDRAAITTPARGTEGTVRRP